MKIAFYNPVPKDKAFQKHSKHEFTDNTCDASCDLVYSASTSTLAKALREAKHYNLPIVSWCWDIAYNWREWSGKTRQSIVETAVERLRKCDLVVSASKWTQGVLLREYKIASEQIYSYATIIKQECHSKIDAAVQVSRFADNKRFEDSIKATFGIINFLAIGIGSVERYGKHKHVRFFNDLKRPTVLQRIAQAKVLLSPSVFEGFGITPVEAIRLGTPFLISDLPVFKEVWGKNGYYHKQRNIDDFRTQLKRLVESKTLGAEIVARCTKRATEFTPKKFAARFDEVLELVQGNL